jgi:hypothetical protein
MPSQRPGAELRNALLSSRTQRRVEPGQQPGSAPSVQPKGYSNKRMKTLFGSAR